MNTSKCLLLPLLVAALAGDAGTLAALGNSPPTLNPLSDVNDLPVISALVDQAINENTSTGPVPFTVADVETPASALIVTGSSSNPTLVPAANIAFGGSGTNRTVTVIPAPNQFGTAMITVMVRDSAGGTASSAFSVKVNALASPLESGNYQTLPGATVEERGDAVPNRSRVVPLSATLTFDLSAAPPSLTAVISNAVLEGGEPFALTVLSSSGFRLNDGTYRFTGDYLRDIQPSGTQYEFDWTFSASTNGQVMWSGTTFWAGGHIWLVTFSDIAMNAVVSPPVIDRIERDGNSIRFHLTGPQLYDYTVEFTDSLSPPNWQALARYRAKLEPIDVVVTNSFTNAQARFFRVRQEFCYCRNE